MLQNYQVEFHTDDVEQADGSLKPVDRVTIKIVGDPNTVIQKVNAEHVKAFPREYAAFKGGRKKIDHGGTKLTDVPGVDREVETNLNFQGVHNAEQLAALSDGQVSSLGRGILTLRNTAKLLIDSKKKAA